MIKLKAENKEQGGVRLELEISGNGGDIIDEFLTVMLELPHRLAEMDGNLFGIATERFRNEVKDIEEEARDGLN